ncbi:MAG TPA: TldD/PmbA family protein, partial [Nitrospirae bacterium]|nr:TldD/PmbA family protein [Nitrospirota bacterium]
MNKIPEELLMKIIKRALANGGDYADVFVQHERPLLIQLEDNKIEKLVSGTDSGVGVRIVFGDRSSYAYSNDLSESSLLDLADAVSRAVREEKGGSPEINLSSVRPSVDFKIKYDPREVDIRKKLQLVENANRAAKDHSSLIKQVSVTYRDSVQNVCIASS